jgi:hypothetical protein
MSKNLDSDTFSSRAKQHRKTFGDNNKMAKTTKVVKNLQYMKNKYEPKTPINEGYKSKDLFKNIREQSIKKPNGYKDRTRERSTVISKLCVKTL